MLHDLVYKNVLEVEDDNPSAYFVVGQPKICASLYAIRFDSTTLQKKHTTRKRGKSLQIRFSNFCSGYT